MEKMYLIRKNVFFHNDLENIAVGLGNVVGVFDDYGKAYEAYLHCERYAHQRRHLASFETASTKDLVTKMQAFYQQHFPQVNHFEEITQIPPLPTEATLEQTAEFIDISGLRHYDLSAHEKMPTYYKIQISDEFWGEEDEFPFTVFPTEVEALYFLQASQEEATRKALGVAFSYLWQDWLEETDAHFAGLQGKLTDLSKTPDILENYLYSCQYLQYDDQKQKICLLPEVEDAEVENVLKELHGLFALLTQKPFSIITIDLEAMRNKEIMLED